jgi:FkbM family methyltransferase
MQNRIARIVSKVKSFPWILKGYARPSYSQVGEDRILHYYFNSIGIDQPSYLDVGTNHPIHGSNTYFFYLKGSSGVCIEPHPDIYKQIKSKRPRDISVNTGIGISNTAEADYFIFPKKQSGWNTFSKEEVDYRKANNQPYERVIKMPLKNINDVIATYCKTTPDFISIDVEGLDFDIIKTLNFEKYTPKALVIETLRMGETQGSYKRTDISEFLKNKGYIVYADTYVNTIFIQS